MAGLAAPFYPIIYVRGYAATEEEREQTVATPYMGFNLGSTKLRRDAEGQAKRFIFESPLVRLIKDYGYQDAFRDGDLPAEDDLGQVAAKSIWIYRYYEEVLPPTVAGGLPGQQTVDASIPDFAYGLRKLILRVRNAVCGNDPLPRQNFKVFLVAHSMGGLICRSYLQNICRNDKYLQDKALDFAGGNDSLVRKVFTYATPHRGIDMLGLNVPSWGPLRIGNFNQKQIVKDLNISNGQANSLDGAFPPQCFFCFVGTNHKDYDAFGGVAKYASTIGGNDCKGDGLVRCDNAYVKGAPRAYAYRSHSGPYGVVNSEEGFQNLVRFLFGDIRVRVSLEISDIAFPAEVSKLIRKNNLQASDIKASYDIECNAQVRGVPVYLSQRSQALTSAINRTYAQILGKNGTTPKPIYLFSGFLRSPTRTATLRTQGFPGTKSPDGAIVFAIHVNMPTPVYEIKRRFWFDQHIEGRSHLNHRVELRMKAKKNGDLDLAYRFDNMDTNGEMTIWRSIAKTTDSEGNAVIRVPIGCTKDCPTPAGRVKGHLVLAARQA